MAVVFWDAAASCERGDNPFPSMETRVPPATGASTPSRLRAAQGVAEGLGVQVSSGFAGRSRPRSSSGRHWGDSPPRWPSVWTWRRTARQ